MRIEVTLDIGLNIGFLCIAVTTTFVALAWGQLEIILSVHYFEIVI